MSRQLHRFIGVSRAVIFSVIFSTASLFVSYQANQSANNANDLAFQANQLSEKANAISEQSNLISQDSRDLAAADIYLTQQSQSSQIVDELFDDLFEDEKNVKCFENMKSGKENNRADLLRFVDNFENLGSKYCKGLVDKEDIRASFVNTLIYLCNDEQTNNFFAGRKNATALLCYTYLPKSKFARSFRAETFETCIFPE